MIATAKAAACLTGGMIALLAPNLPTPSARPASTGYRFIKPPIVPVQDGDVLNVYVRLNRSLPRERSGKLQAALWVADAGGNAFVSTVGKRARRCYAAPIDTSFSRSHVLRHPKVDARVSVTLFVRGKLAARTHVRLSRELRTTGQSGDAPYIRALACR